jgi:hypothetical protein
MFKAKSVRGQKADMEIDLQICAADLDHHSKVVGTTGGNVDTSPVACVKRGVFPIDYLDKFPPDSIYAAQIAEFKQNGKS